MFRRFPCGPRSRDDQAAGGDEFSKYAAPTFTSTATARGHHRAGVRRCERCLVRQRKASGMRAGRRRTRTPWVRPAPPPLRAEASLPGELERLQDLVRRGEEGRELLWRKLEALRNSTTLVPLTSRTTIRNRSPRSSLYESGAAALVGPNGTNRWPNLPVTSPSICHPGSPAIEVRVVRPNFASPPADRRRARIASADGVPSEAVSIAITPCGFSACIRASETQPTAERPCELVVHCAPAQESSGGLILSGIGNDLARS